MKSIQQALSAGLMDLLSLHSVSGGVLANEGQHKFNIHESLMYDLREYLLSLFNISKLN